MDSTQRISIALEDSPADNTPGQIVRWFAHQFEQLGWGPEVDQKGNLLLAEASGTSASAPG